MKQLTQEVFKDAPDWVKSAAVDGDGMACWYSVDEDELFVSSVVDVFAFDDSIGGTFEFIDGDYDATNWQDSAINREYSEGSDV